eukprot:sb/3478486/
MISTIRHSGNSGGTNTGERYEGGGFGGSGFNENNNMNIPRQAGSMVSAERDSGDDDPPCNLLDIEGGVEHGTPALLDNEDLLLINTSDPPTEDFVLVSDK